MVIVSRCMLLLLVVVYVFIMVGCQLWMVVQLIGYCDRCLIIVVVVVGMLKNFRLMNMCLLWWVSLLSIWKYLLEVSSFMLILQKVMLLLRWLIYFSVCVWLGMFSVKIRCLLLCSGSGVWFMVCSLGWCVWCCGGFGVIGCNCC